MKDFSLPNDIFKPRNILIDWKKICINNFILAGIDFNHHTPEQNFDIIQQNIFNITYCNIENEINGHNINQNYVKLFRIAQYTIEYLLFTQDELLKRLDGNKEKYGKLRESYVKLRGMVDKLNVKLAQHKKEIVRNQQIIKSYKEIFLLCGLNCKDVTNTLLHQCPYCAKSFISDEFLISHLERKHHESHFDGYANSSSKTKQFNEKNSTLLSSSNNQRYNNEKVPITKYPLLKRNPISFKNDIDITDTEIDNQFNSPITHSTLVQKPFFPLTNTNQDITKSNQNLGVNISKTNLLQSQSPPYSIEAAIQGMLNEINMENEKRYVEDLQCMRTEFGSHLKSVADTIVDKVLLSQQKPKQLEPEPSQEKDKEGSFQTTQPGDKNVEKINNIIQNETQLDYVLPETTFVAPPDNVDNKNIANLPCQNTKNESETTPYNKSALQTEIKRIEKNYKRDLAQQEALWKERIENLEERVRKQQASEYGSNSMSESDTSSLTENSPSSTNSETQTISQSNSSTKLKQQKKSSKSNPKNGKTILENNNNNKTLQKSTANLSKSMVTQKKLLDNKKNILKNFDTLQISRKNFNSRSTTSEITPKAMQSLMQYLGSLNTHSNIPQLDKQQHALSQTFVNGLKPKIEASFQKHLRHYNLTNTTEEITPKRLEHTTKQIMAHELKMTQKYPTFAKMKENINLIVDTALQNQHGDSSHTTAFSKKSGADIQKNLLPTTMYDKMPPKKMSQSNARNDKLSESVSTDSTTSNLSESGSTETPQENSVLQSNKQQPREMDHHIKPNTNHLKPVIIPPSSIQNTKDLNEKIDINSKNKMKEEISSEDQTSGISSSGSVAQIVKNAKDMKEIAKNQSSTSHQQRVNHGFISSNDESSNSLPHLENKKSKNYTHIPTIDIDLNKRTSDSIDKKLITNKLLKSNVKTTEIIDKNINYNLKETTSPSEVEHNNKTSQSRTEDGDETDTTTNNRDELNLFTKK